MDLLLWFIFAEWVQIKKKSLIMLKNPSPTHCGYHFPTLNISSMFQLLNIFCENEYIEN